MKKLLRRCLMSVVDGPLEWVVPAPTRRTLGGRILDRASGQNDVMSDTNGEDLLAAAVARQFGSTPAVVVDVGANVGDWTRVILPRLPAGSRMFCFEPTPTTYQVLEGRLRERRRDVEVTLVNAALGDADGSAEIYAIAGEPYLNSLHRRAVDGFAENAKPVAISIRRGDAFFREAGVERIDFLKLDVEGHEVSVLRGLEPLITGRRIGRIQFEYGGAWIDSRTFLKDAFDILTAAGYSLAKVHARGVQHLRSYQQAMDNFQHSNFLALLPECRDGLPTVA